MIRAELFKIQLYRIEPGDLKIVDVLQADLGQARELAKNRLENHFSDAKRKGQGKPTHARILNESGEIVAAFRRDFNGVVELQP